MANINFKLKNPDVFDFIAANGGNDYRDKWPNGLPVSLTVEAENSSEAVEILKTFTNTEMWELVSE